MATSALRNPAFAAALFLASVAPAAGADGKADEPLILDLARDGAAADWAPFKLPGTAEAPAPTAEIAEGQQLKLTFAGGDWPAVACARIAAAGNWKTYQTIKAEFTADRHCIAYLGFCQKSKPEAPVWEHTLNLLPGKNAVVLGIRRGYDRCVIDPARGEVTSVVVGMFRPEKGQTLLMGGLRLCPDWPEPKTLGWTSPYNHDGYSAAAAREFERTKALPKFKVLGTDLEVNDLKDLATRLKDKWAKPAAKTIEQVEADFKAEFAKIRETHPKAALAILRQGAKGWNPADPEAPYAGWSYVYVNCHGPDGPNSGREKTPAQAEIVEVFMRHRSVLMRTDLSSLGAAEVLAARLAITRGPSQEFKIPEKPNMWVAEPCTREWDIAAANCYQYAPGKLWKGVSGMYYGDDPDHWPVYAAHGPAGGGAVTDWDFTHMLRFWLHDGHVNHGFFLHGDSNDYIRMYTPLAKDPAMRPVLMVVYEPKAK